jgi:tubulin--tyrosine ligase
MLRQRRAKDAKSSARARHLAAWDNEASSNATPLITAAKHGRVHHRMHLDELSVAAGLLYHAATIGHGVVVCPPRLRAVVRADCAYADALLEAAFLRRSATWEVSRSSGAACHAALAVDEYEELDWSRVLGPPFMLASSFCMRKGLGRKSNLAVSLAAHALRCRGCPLASALPFSVCIDTVSVFHTRPAWLDFASALAEALSEGEDAIESAASAAAVAGEPPPVWIMKPSVTNKALGIELVRNYEDVVAAVRGTPEVGTWVMQRYVPNPLLLLRQASVGHKFHLRLYVLAVGALTVYLFREGLVLIAPQAYNDDIHDRASHITNTCVGMENASFDEGTHVRSLAELPALLCEAGHAGGEEQAAALVELLYADARRVVAHSFAAQESAAGAYMPLPRCFELYGVDFLVDAGMRLVLLEFNPSPDIKQTGSRLGGMMSRMVSGAIEVAVDRRVTAVEQRRRRGPPPAPSSEHARSYGPPSQCEAHGCIDDATVVEVDVLPPPPPPGCVTDGCAIVGSAPDESGWDIVYTKLWVQAHGKSGMTVN